ncbi:hypothetical protein Mapa_006672 [Marchantia paleacea]|nr:hypothetical protein Mapa_006672 [Marchantia paleacea]
MGSIDVGRPPDGDSCSDEDESSVLSRAERDLQADSPHEAVHWIPRAISFRQFSPRTPRTRTGGMQGGGGAGLHVVVTRPLVVKLTKEVVETYQLCNPTFTYSVTFNPKRYLTNPSTGVSNGGLDNVNSDLILYVNGILHNADYNRRYIVKDMLGQGTFGQVCKCWTDDSNNYVAVKVIKNQPAYFHQAQVEIGICHMLNHQYDPRDTHNIVRILDHFVYEGHLCLVFELLQANLFELLKLNQFRGLSMTLVRSFTRQMLEALMVLRDACVIHCDLKPENILLQSLEAAEIKLIDFGSACTENRTVYSYIQSRYYRSPEVLLGHQYTTAIDIWSLGCVAAELFLGLPLFPGASEYDLLQRMIETLGSQPPDHVLRNAKHSSKFFKHTSATPVSGLGSSEGHSSVYQFLNEAEFEAREQRKPAFGKRYFGHRKLDDIIVNYPLRRRMTPEETDAETQIRVAFIDFLMGLVNFDPVSRWTPRQALQHPFLTEAAFSGPFRPPPETPRRPVGHGMAVEHNPVSGHWFGAGLSPQVNHGMRYNTQYQATPFSFASSYGSIGSYGSYGDSAGLGSSYGSYGDSSGMYMSYPTTPVAGVNTQNQGGSANAALGVSPDTWRRMQVPNLPQTQLGMSPSSSGFRAMSLGASPSHSQFAASPGSQFHGSPSSSFHPSPGSNYQASPSSQYLGSPASQFLASPSSPSQGSPSRYGPTSPARTGVGASSLGKVAQYKMTKRRAWEQRVPVSNPNAHDLMAAHRQRLHQQNANGNEAGIRSVSSQGPPHLPHRRHRSNAGPHRPQSSNSYAPGSLGALLNSPDTVSEVGEDISPPPDPGDWDPNYSDDSLLDDSLDASASTVPPLDLNEVVSGVSRLGPSSYSGPGQGIGSALLPYQHVHGSVTSGQSRLNGTVQGQVPMGSNVEGNVNSPQSSSHGLQPGFPRNPSKHGPYAPQQTSPSRLGPQTAQIPQQHRPQLQSHQSAAQQHSPDVSPSIGTTRGQMVGEPGNNAPVGLLPSPQRDTRGGYPQNPRVPGNSGLGVVMGLPGVGSNTGPAGTGFHMITGSWLPNVVQEQHLSQVADPSSPLPPWGPPGYPLPYAQNLLPHDFSTLGARPGHSLVVVSRPLPPTGPNRGNYGSRRSG